VSAPADVGSGADVALHIQEYLEADLDRVADETVRIDQGLVARTRSLPQVWTLNQLRIMSPSSAEEVVALAQLHQGDLPYRHVVVTERDTAAALELELSGKGWRIEHDLYLAMPADARLDGPDHEPSELDEQEMVELMRQWMVEEHPDASAEALEQLDQYQLRSARASTERRFGVRDEAGRPVALTKLRSHGTTAWVEDVYTVPTHRGRGNARRLVTYAAALGVQQGHQLVFIIADDDDWPKGLYAEVGFRPVGRGSILHFEPGRAAG
jgi:GNAT superfamily N-acetyltransferase